MYVNARAIIERSLSDQIEILLQTRNKPGQRRQLELPGGQVEPYESLVVALRREVSEETGLDVLTVEGQDCLVVAAGEQARVECIQPFAVYQTVSGPVDSMGVYFRCTASGRLRSQQEEAADARWYPRSRLQTMIDKDVEQFSWVDRAGLLFYLSACCPSS